MKKYRTSKYHLDIQEKEISRETKSTVFFIKDLKERREAKIGASWQYHDSKQDAISHLISYHESMVRIAQEQVIRRQKVMAELLEKYNQK